MVPMLITNAHHAHWLLHHLGWTIWHLAGPKWAALPPPQNP